MFVVWLNNSPFFFREDLLFGCYFLSSHWPRIASLYAELSAIASSPVVELNRAIAIAMAEGPEVGLAIVEGLACEPSLKGYHLLPSVRGDLLFRLGRFEEASAAFQDAAAQTQNRREQDLLGRRANDAANRRRR